jgi:hypothetical protein
VSQRIDQSNLDDFREWYKINHDLRAEEAEWLDAELREAEERLEQIGSYLEEYKGRRGSSSYDHDDQRRQEVERNFQFAYEWTWKIKRRQRELMRWEREDLEWLDRLEGRQRAVERANRGEHARGQDGEHRPRPKARSRRNRPPHTTRDNE